MMNKATTGEVRKLKDGNGRFALGGFAAAGRTCQPARLPGGGGGGYAQHRHWLTVDCVRQLPARLHHRGRVGVRLLVDRYTNKPYVRLYMWKRVGGDVNDFHAIKLLKFSA
jgi:predicted phage gp36 major capsid-like protein